MNITINTINPEFVEHEGFYYLVFEGEYFKGCKRCGGEGHYSHNGEHSRCFECDNTAAKLGDVLGSKAAAEKWCHVRALAKANRERKAEAKRLAELAKREAAQAALKEIAPDVVEFLLSIDLGPNYSDYATYDEYANAEAGWTTTEKNNFVRAMAETFRYEIGTKKNFTENMIAAVRKTIAQRAEKAAVDAAKPALVEGRRVITGKVISTKAVEGDYGTSYKMLVEEADGQRVYGSIPGALWDEVEFLGAYRKHAWNETDGVMTKLVGMEVTFTATVEVSRDDKSFGFFKRPAKASIVA